MKSIQKTLSRRLSVGLSLLILTVLIIADVSLDGWIEDEFNRNMINKIGLLQTLVNEDANGIEFEFSGEYMPEFEGSVEPEYFQLWYDGEVFERSDTLAFHSQMDLPFKTTALHEIELQNLELPDGRLGRIAFITFTPQIDSKDRDKLAENRPVAKQMTLAYATSREELEYYLWLIDISFILAVILVPLIIRFIVNHTVYFTLSPLQNLKRDIQKIHFTSHDNNKLVLAEPIEELMPIVESLNHFIEQNYTLYKRERQLTSDIAHELKTPVTELLNLTEVAMRFSDRELETSYKPEVLQIALRMKNIISNLMMLHKHSQQSLECNDTFDFAHKVQELIERQSVSRFSLTLPGNQSFLVTSNLFAVEAIINNLFENALCYSPDESKIEVEIERINEQSLQLLVSNQLISVITQDELVKMFDPLWQKDQSRTSNENFGLGLSIVKVLSDAINASIDASVPDDKICFKLVLPVENKSSVTTAN
ncbi:ATP-binding protein [Neptunicella marina]|uniref:histidine kinase n=1 Tax=Neptunicella marina TaxID=2125989 RepID=A0A8J6J093_9ALTE|nr:ATP-binding protein [Neptunicella marina]MBC3767548.1 sensor histidine kinase [Neptunicella marina]